MLRVLPRLNEDVNEEWISDKTRFAVDGLGKRRLDRPYVRRAGKLAEATWPEAFAAIAGRLKGVAGDRCAAIAGDLADAEAMMALKDLMVALGSPHLDCRQDGAKLDPSCRAGYLFNTTIAGIEQADACILIGTNPRAEAAILNARLRKRALQGGFRIGAFGPPLDLTFAVSALGTGPQGLVERAREFLKRRQAADACPGAGRARRTDGAAILALARLLAESAGMVREGWNGFNVLHLAASRVAASISVSFPPRAVATSRESSPDAKAARSNFSICLAPTRSTPSGSARPSSSIRAITATAAPRAPMSCCPAPPIPKKTRLM